MAYGNDLAYSFGIFLASIEDFVVCCTSVNTNLIQNVLHGLYDATTDWIPIYGKSQLPGFYMAFGSSGNQYKNAPIA